MRWKVPIFHILVLLSIVFILPHTGILKDPNDINLSQSLLAPSREFPLGTDNLGRCLLSRTINGGETTIKLGISATILSLMLGVSVATVSVMIGQATRNILMVIIDGWFAFPDLLLMLVSIVIMGNSFAGIVLSLTISGWAWWARFVKNLLIESYNQDYVISARLFNISNIKLFRKYILPQVLPTIFTAFLLRLSRTIVLSGGVGFLGFGIQPPTPEWGAMIRDSLHLVLVAPWTLAGPALGLVVTVVLLQWSALDIKNIADYRGYTFLRE